MKKVAAVLLGLAVMNQICVLRAADDNNAAPEKPVFISLTRTALPPEDLPTNTSVMTSEDIEALNAQNVGDAVAVMTGVSEVKTGSLGLTRLPTIRGFSNNRVRVVIDDQPMPPDLTGNFDLSQIPADIVDRIEIVRGGDSMAYGANAEGGVIHIITKHAQAAEPNLALSSQYGSFNTQEHRLELGGKGGPAEGFFTVSRSLSNGFQQNSDFHNLSFSGNAAYDFGAAGKTSLRFFLSNSEVGVPSGTPVPIGQFNGSLEQQANDPTARQKDHTQTLQAEHAVPLGNWGDVKVRFDADDTRRFFTSPQLSFTDENRIASRTGTLLYDLPAGVSGGFEYNRQFLNSISEGVHDQASWASFLEEHAEIAQVLTVIVGYRHDQSVQYGAADDPHGTLVWRAAPWLKLSSNVSRAFHAPTFADLFNPLAAPDPNLRAETSMHYDVGAELTPFEGVSSKTTVFRADTDNQIALDPNRNFAAFNLTRAHSTGVEEEINVKTGPVTQQLNYTYQNVEGEAPGSSDFQLLQFSPHNIGNYLIAASLPADCELSSNVRYVDQEFTGINKTGVSIPSHAVWGIKAAKNFRIQKVEGQAFFGVDNVLDHSYAENADSFNGFFPQPGRTYYGGASIKIW